MLMLTVTALNMAWILASADAINMSQCGFVEKFRGGGTGAPWFSGSRMLHCRNSRFHTVAFGNRIIATV